jgi:transcriptional regulator with XRE-family HTH domain
MVIGDKIRNLRTLKGLSQENMAGLLNMSLVAYGDIERNKKDINLTRLEQIAQVLDLTVSDILTFGDRISNFFDQCNQPSVFAGANNTQHNNYDVREIQYKLEIALLEIEKMKVEKEKAELEVKYWREKSERA